MIKQQETFQHEAIKQLMKQKVNNNPNLTPAQKQAKNKPNKTGKNA